MNDASKCRICGELPEIYAGSSGDGFASFYLEHCCEKDKEGKYRSVAFDICAVEDNEYTLIKEWNKHFGESND